MLGVHEIDLKNSWPPGSRSMGANVPLRQTRDTAITHPEWCVIALRRLMSFPQTHVFPVYTDLSTGRRCL